MEQSLLGGLSARDFLRRHWQKKPLLVRAALPGFTGVIDRGALFSLAARHDVESRLVERRAAGWRLSHGPLQRARLERAGRRDWTLLVSGVNHFCAAAERLLRRFAFVPQARLDDLMVSYAVPGGGVGPHFDSYDVFLLQGAGRRLWRLAPARRKSGPHGEAHCSPHCNPFTLEPDAPLRLIAGFRPDEEYLLEPGDLLYLPPGWGHDGVALEACFTCSVGFRAPRAAELAAAFLDFLHLRGLPEAEYRDPGLRPATHAARIGAPLARWARSQVARIRWREADVETFFGEYLSTPKSHVVFQRPRRPLARAAFLRRLERAGVALDARTQLLYRGGRFFLNGETLRPPRGQLRALAALADLRRAPGRALVRAALGDLVYDWYRSGFLRPESLA